MILRSKKDYITIYTQFCCKTIMLCSKDPLLWNQKYYKTLRVLTEGFLSLYACKKINLINPAHPVFLVHFNKFLNQIKLKGIEGEVK